MSRFSSLKGWRFLFAGGLFLSLFGLVGKDISHTPRQRAGSEFLLTLPIVAQVVMTGGDRYLAANLATFRALVASTESMTADDFALQAKIQTDVAWLNPAQEDNYYIAAAILPWYGQLEASQLVLRRASDARPFDWQPPFYYAFNTYYFLKDSAEAARWLRIASEHTDVEENVLAFQQISALWAAKGPDIEVAIKLHRDLIKATKHKEFGAFLEKRIMRLENLLLIERAIASFRIASGRAPEEIGDLVKAGVIARLPVDPFGMRYALGKDGRPVAIAAARVAGGAH
jgi:tetratricopeptide (TPR) repeat protein